MSIEAWDSQLPFKGTLFLTSERQCPFFQFSTALYVMVLKNNEQVASKY